MTRPRFLAGTMRPTRLTESHCDPRKHAFGFGFMNGQRIVGSLGMPAKRIREPKSPENASELWITR
ncbi:hypothetical protein BF49_2848 [Bradyrhizobium sp.]|nr:hypothetical protein BF49_2848 [Bradyrhizobium sp.]